MHDFVGVRRRVSRTSLRGFLLFVLALLKNLFLTPRCSSLRAKPAVIAACSDRSSCCAFARPRSLRKFSFEKRVGGATNGKRDENLQRSRFCGTSSAHRTLSVIGRAGQDVLVSSQARDARSGSNQRQPHSEKTSAASGRRGRRVLPRPIPSSIAKRFVPIHPKAENETKKSQSVPRVPGHLSTCLPACLTSNLSPLTKEVSGDDQRAAAVPDEGATIALSS